MMKFCLEAGKNLLPSSSATHGPGNHTNGPHVVDVIFDSEERVEGVGCR